MNKKDATLGIQRHLWTLGYRVKNQDGAPWLTYDLVVDGQYRVRVIEADPDDVQGKTLQDGADLIAAYKKVGRKIKRAYFKNGETEPHRSPFKIIGKPKSKRPERR
jgi:hypothetical protein